MADLPVRNQESTPGMKPPVTREWGPSSCHCRAAHHDGKLLVVTGGPGAGKTALLEIARRHFCEHVVVLPEAASVLYGGGFPRRSTPPSQRAAQRAIFYTQRELERMALEEHTAGLVLCDRGTLDGAAFWPGDPAQMWRDLQTTPYVELARYCTVIHLRPPPVGEYNHVNPLRIESAREAALIDERIAAAWHGHPRVHIIDHSQKFMDKVMCALKIIRAEIPECCRG